MCSGKSSENFHVYPKDQNYGPEEMIDIIRACIFLWNFGLLCGDNKGYNPDDFVIEEEDKLNANIEASEGGKLIRDIVCQYLWEHR